MDTWIAGHFGADGNGSRPGRTADPVLMGRTGAALYACGAALALVWMALPHPEGANDLVLLGVVILAFAGAGVMWFGAARLGQAAYHAFVAAGILLVSAAILFSGRTGTPFVLFYLWSNLYACYFFRPRSALCHLAFTGLAYAVVLGVRDPVAANGGTSHGLVAALGPSPARWLITVGTAAITGLLVVLLRSRVERLITRLTEERNFVSRVVETTPTLLIIFDLEGRIQGFNRASEELTGYRGDDLRGRDGGSLLFAPEEHEHRERQWQAVLASQQSRDFDAQIVTRDGERRIVAWSVAAGRDAAGEPDHLIATGIDVTERKRGERALQRRAARAAAVAELGRSGLQGSSLVQLADHTLSIVESHLEVSRCELWEPAPFSDELQLWAARGPLRDQVGRLTVSDVRAVDPSGLVVPIPGPRGQLAVLTVHPGGPDTFADDDAVFLESVAHVLGAAVARWRAEESARHNALHDPLTGLPNRALFLDRLRHVLARRRENGPHASVMFLDIDNFKLVNDSLGHDAGDRLLQAVATRLRGSLRPSDTVARFGGDEFVVLCEEVGDGRDAVVVAERIQQALAEPFHLDGEDHFLSASIGIAVATGRYEDADALLADADAAMYGAKERGRAQCELFDDTMRDRVLGRLRMENALRGAIDRDELRVFYQPIVSLADGSVRSLEALMRWNHPGLGPVSPLEFIPIAEETGLIVPLGAWVVGEVCRQSAEWSARLGVAVPPISVNLSPRQAGDAGLIPMVREALERNALDPSRLAFEITESVLVTEAHSPWKTLDALKRVGVKLMLDDFGTGYSSLSYLKRFPVDVLKIDRAFVDGLPEDPEDSAIVTAVVGMARALEIDVIAEGVETERQVTALRELGCGQAQGFLFGRPREAAATAELLRPPDPIAGIGILPAPAPVL
ncbi:MAG: EAL domain-containing protein [Actinobacteria bacterium]|nr:EAL domain-containing protein [Actinomycetota bacterium]